MVFSLFLKVQHSLLYFLLVLLHQVILFDLLFSLLLFKVVKFNINPYMNIFELIYPVYILLVVEIKSFLVRCQNMWLKNTLKMQKSFFMMEDILYRRPQRRKFLIGNFSIVLYRSFIVCSSDYLKVFFHSIVVENHHAVSDCIIER